MLRSTRVSDYMLRHPVLVHPETDLFEAIHQILIHKISGVTVVDRNRVPGGGLSERDRLRAIRAGTYYQHVGGTVGEYMSKGDVQTALPSDDILEVAQSMLDEKRRRRPVIDDHGMVIGQVTCRQVLKAVKDFDTPEDPREGP